MSALLLSRIKGELREARQKSSSYQKQALEWRDKYFKAQREVEELRRKVRGLELAIPKLTRK